MTSHTAIASRSLLGAALALAAVHAHADEGGVPFWFSGQYSSLSATPATPGWSFTTMGYGYSGSASTGKLLPRGNTVSAGVSSDVALLLAQPSYAPETKWLGGQASLGVGFGYGRNSTKADIATSALGVQLNRTDTVNGFTDLYPVVSIAWTQGVHNWMTYATGDIPVGAYDSNRLANIGIGHAAFDAGGGYTYLDPQSGREFSIVGGFTYNWENSDTKYKNGVDSHIDWAASQFLSANWEVGLAGYVYYQLSGDSGSGARLGPFKSRVAAIGPEVGYAFKVGGLPAYANLRAYYEFWAQNRVSGYAVFATLVLPLGK
ncbi:transporter [Variovorax sp. J31P179]|uniref:SphA family protein n=1 Tax=Variovorax sp. J31P179 TaxID=3053508 RepID=UPI002574C9E8|nr:transporter [Variovorax sp. J31P179]MDM0082885.1 transporter [Variovorax sp. J31P179]